MNHEKHMRLAIEAAKNNPASPFGAVIVDGESGEVLATAFNEGHRNPVRHGETAAIYDLAEKNPDVEWSRLTLYTTAEPCPMCAGAILWAGIPRVVIGTSAETLKKLGVLRTEIPIHEVVSRSSFGEVDITSGVLKGECDALYEAVVG
ncbi:MAG: nucleoside deaminase [Rubrobacter sp.]|jgi:tRNA(Arg) A34 adenosine deaminase TadA|nr:nucleoside deaminase [Rubrobacter sp.]